MNPLLGVLYHWLGGLASASFYVPYRGVKRWSWEIYWLTGGVVSWLVADRLLLLAVEEQQLADPFVLVARAVPDVCLRAERPR